MAKSTPSYLTLDQAVALMINLDYIPERFTLLEMIDAFTEVAEVDLENARIEHKVAEEIRQLESRRDVCISRHNLCTSLIDSLADEAQMHQESPIKITFDESGAPLFEFSSLQDWASEQHGIDISIDRVQSAKPDVPAVRWEDVTIKIKTDNRVAWSDRNGKALKKDFFEIGLFDRKKRQPNRQGGILIGMSKGRKFPASLLAQAEAKDKTAIAKLRNSLKKLTAINEDPFLPFNPSDGWRPKFKLVDARRAADERAEREAKHVSFDDARDNDD